MGFLLSSTADGEAVEQYFWALLRAQQEIDLEPHRYTRHWAREMPGDLLNIVDVRRFGPGERIVPQPYTKEMFERTQGWMQAWDLLDPTSQPVPAYEATVLV